MRRRFDSIAARDSAIVALALARITPKEIERRIYASRGTIYVAIQNARRRGVDIPPFSTAGDGASADARRVSMAGRPRLRLPKDLRDRLDAEAARRGITLSKLANQLLAAIVGDDLFDAVLDR